jgi:hypothetical protein
MESAMDRFARFCRNYGQDVPPTMHVFPRYHADEAFVVTIEAGKMASTGSVFRDLSDFDEVVCNVCDAIDAAESKRRGSGSKKP